MMDVQYKIIGGDGAEYGPATLDELKNWIHDGRVAGMTKVWRSDLAIWTPADRYSELRPDLAILHAAASAQAARPCGFWARLAAYILDSFILCTLFLMVWTPIADSHNWTMPEWPHNTSDAATREFVEQAQTWWHHAWPVFYPIFLIYSVLLNGRFGATFGKMAIGARITMLNGAPIGYRRALLRWLAARLSDLTLFFGYLLIAFHPEKRALHDLLAGTKVVYN
jgi:uncharacterized RDD family membrane protein YckC